MLLNSNLKYLIVCIVFFGCIINSFAQINLGLQLGSGIAGLNTNPLIEQSVVQSFSGGLSFRYRNPKYPAGFQSNLLYQINGWHEKNDTANYTSELHTLTLDLNTVVLLGNNNLKFMISAGPFISKILKNNESLSFGIPYFKYESGTDFAYYYGLSGAIGIQYHFDKNTILMDVKGYSGLSPLFKKNPNNPFENGYQQYVLISLSWYFSLA